ncbi:MAG: nucleotidyltransferase domain-containing protein [Polyangiaceae bacterium]|nr:nucleotidyltransferase domain-containing protein [Polyangiaceae bacterium]
MLPKHVTDVLTTTQAAVMKRVLEEEEALREHVVVYLSGAHAYGFPSPDSDLDLKAIHVANTTDLLGFEPPAPTIDRAEIIDGVEVDYTSNELAHALAGILGGNGNFIERVLGRMTPYASKLVGELRPIVQRALSRRVYRHYNGFARNQLRFLEKEPTAKKLLYVLRTTLTGIHLLETGEVEPNLAAIMSDYDVPDAADLIERKRAGERVPLDPKQLEAWRPRIDALFDRLDAARETSLLPEDPPNENELRDWLLTVRRSRLRDSPSHEVGRA